MANSAIQSAQFGVATESQRGVVNGTDARNLVFNGSALSFRNALLNGGMAVDQRNAGAAQTFTAGAALAYSVDRWYGYCTGANVTGQRVAGSDNTQYRYRFTGAASVTGIGFGQRIEQLNAYRFAGTTATLSVDLSNSLLTTVTWTAYYANSADAFGTLASPTRTQIATGTFTVSSTLTRYSTQIAIPAAATTGIEIVFSVGAQTSGTWVIGNAQMECSSVATPFENRPIGQVLQECQRYYERQSVRSYVSYNPGAVNDVLYGSWSVEKRASPQLSISNATQINVANVGVEATKSWTVGVTGAGSIGYVGATITASAEL